MGRLAWLLLVAITLAPLPSAHAEDRTLSEGHPVRLADAFPIATGEGALLAGAGVLVPRRGEARAIFPVELQYGIFTRTQLSIGTTLSSNPHEADDPRSGDLDLSVRVNFGRETPILPTFAALLGATLPTGTDSRAYGVTAKAYATKTIGRSLFLHLNAEEDVSDRVERGERRARYRLVSGASWTIPRLATLAVVGDVFTDQATRRGDPSTVGAEVGVRSRLTASIYWDAGAGTTFAGPGDRARFFFTTGVTIGFGPFGATR
jgi:hypothetical protein